MPILKSLPRVIRSFRYRGGLVVRRMTSTGADQYGQDAPTVESTFRLDPVVIQPLEGADLLQLDAGDRDREIVLLHTCQPVRVSRGGSLQGSDVLEYDPTGQGGIFLYRFEKSEPWVAQAGFYRCRAVRIEGDS